jgi:hypothetical protein|tara:strand:- start:16573 stop:16770 length:198 start_codon:yes stop_codon:yes gene_type:complete
MEKLERKFRQISESRLPILDKAPNIVNMIDGESVLAREPGKNPRLYLKLGTKLYYSEFTELTKGS